MRNPWKYFKYLYLFMNLTFAAIQVLFFYIHTMRDDFSYFFPLFHTVLFCYFIFVGVVSFEKHRELQARHDVLFATDFLDQLLEELTERHLNRTIETVNWKRDGF